MHVRENVTQPTDQSYRLIALTQGQFTKVDAADFEWLNQWKWFAVWNRYTKSFYAARHSLPINGKRQYISMHRLILGVLGSKVLVDHEDMDTLNNQRYNIRKATHSQNNSNRTKLKSNTSGFKGVTAHGKRWRTGISIEGRHRYLGVYDTREEAHAAYCEAALKFKGEFAKF